MRAALNRREAKKGYGGEAPIIPLREAPKRKNRSGAEGDYCGSSSAASNKQVQAKLSIPLEDRTAVRFFRAQSPHGMQKAGRVRGPSGQWGLQIGFWGCRLSLFCGFNTFQP